MKKTDIAMIILIATVSVVAAFFLTRTVFGGDPNEPVKIKTIEAINTSMVEPDPAVFNENAINPAIEVQINSGKQ